MERILWAVPLLVCLGCGQTANQSSSKNDAESRLKAAMAISNESMRDTSLSNVAEYAADKGDTQVVLKALHAIGNTSLKDNHAQTCAYKLHKAGQVDGAVWAAKAISMNLCAVLYLASSPKV